MIRKSVGGSSKNVITPGLLLSGLPVRGLTLIGLAFLTSTLTSPLFAAETFAGYVNGLRQDASQVHGVSSQTLDRVFPGIKPFRTVSPAKTGNDNPKSLDSYLPATLTDALVGEAKFQHQGHSELLNRIGTQYGVQPRFIVALWGLASGYGRDAGGLPVLSVTASNAFKGENESLYRSQFFAALKIIDQMAIDSSQLLADSEGRLGQSKLLPERFLKAASDGDNDGEVDIWQNPADVFASLAAFLKDSGWQADATWGRQVKIPAGFDESLANKDVRESFAKWKALGVTRFDGGDLPSREDIKAAMVMPDGPSGRVYLVYDNYFAIKHWFNDDYLALAMVHLSDRIKFDE